LKEEDIMKKNPLFGLAALLGILFLYACGSAQTAVEKEKLATDVRNAVEIPDFTRGNWNKIQGFRHAFAD